MIPENTSSFLHLRRHFPQMRGSSHKRKDLENQAATFQNLTESPNSCACHFSNNFTLKSRLHVFNVYCHHSHIPQFRPDYQITIYLAPNSTFLVHDTRFTRQEILRNATPHILEQHTDFYSRLHICLLTLKECPIYRPTKILDKMQ